MDMGDDTKDAVEHSCSHPDAEPVPVKLFVGRVPTTLEDADVRIIFEEIGPVSECQIIRNKETGEHKSSAFVTMTSLTDADKAAGSFHNVRRLDGATAPMQVRYAVGESERLGLTADCSTAGQSEATLFVGSVPRSSQAEDVKLLFDPYGKIHTVFILKDSVGESKGCGFVKFAFKEQAIQAMKALNQKHTMPGASRPLDVRFASGRNKDSNIRSPSGSTAVAKPLIGVPSVSVAQCSTALLSAPPPFVSTLPQPPALVQTPMHSPTLIQPSALTQSPTSLSSVGYAWPPAPQSTSQVVAPQVSNCNPRVAGPWKEYTTPDGQIYYHNDSTNVATWQRPMEFDLLSASLASPYATFPANTFQQTQSAGPTMQLMPGPLTGTGSQGALLSGTALSEKAGPPGSNLFLFHIPNSWRQEDIISHFSSFGRIVSARVPMNTTSGVSLNKGFAFLSYDSVPSAVKAISQMNGFMVNGKRLKVSVKKGEEEHVNDLLRTASQSAT